ncbi:ROK family protein [Aureimonas sp. AU40]|uniref:ROK family protein n=1 Tax=Aureimonas sp. AU40 TaxID=1637747 RepID=UPI0007836240|nr:ROK family protein [Aureimonas sp. AU40]
MGSDIGPFPRLAVGIDLGGTQIRGALIDETGAVLHRAVMATAATEGAEAVVAQIADLARAMSLEARTPVLGIGLSAPGPLDAANGIALATPTIAGFTDFPLARAVEARSGLPVLLENDGIAAAIGEWRFGAGQGADHMVYATVSTGIGGGIVSDGRVLRGRMGMAGHIGHMTIVRDGALCACGHRGCFEAHASGTAFLRRAREAAAGESASQLHANRGALSAASVFEAAEAGDALAGRLVEEEAELLGLGFASLLHLYSPQILVMGGGMSRQFARLGPLVEAAMRRAALAPFRAVPLVAARLGDNAGLVGAASLLFEADRFSRRA